jgi:putative heme iron utilization protein
MAEADPNPMADAAWQARCLMRAARVASLATVAHGQPFVALVTPATAPDLSVLLWLSSLSEHTRQLQAEPRCALLVSGAAEGPNPQTAPRLTVTGLAEQVADAALKARWLVMHPYAALYADFADFSLWRVRLVGGNLVGGFARATRLRQADLAPDPAAVAGVDAAAEGIMAHCNADHADAMEAIGGKASGADGAWRMVGVDVDGFDLARDETVIRVAFGSPVADAGGVRAELVRMARAAR